MGGSSSAVIQVTAAVNGQFIGFYLNVGGVAPKPPVVAGLPLYGLATRAAAPVPLTGPGLIIGFDVPAGGATPSTFNNVKVSGGAINSTFDPKVNCVYDAGTNSFQWAISSQFVVGTVYTFAFT